MAQNVSGGPQPVLRDGVYFSPDGRWRWDGQQWVPAAQQAQAVAAKVDRTPQAWLAFFFTGPQNRWYSEGKRATYGLLYLVYTLILSLAFMGSLGKLTASFQDFLVSLVLAGLVFLAGSYAWRIWTWRARRLLLFIVF